MDLHPAVEAVELHSISIEDGPPDYRESKGMGLQIIMHVKAAGGGGGGVHENPSLLGFFPLRGPFF